MPSRSSIPKRPRDLNQLARMVADTAIGDAEDVRDITGKNPAAVLLGRLGGRKGGAARAAKLSKRRRHEIAKRAAQTRWAAKPGKS
jgi:hypothetical protein